MRLAKTNNIGVSDVVVVDNEDVDLAITLNPTGIEINKAYLCKHLPQPNFRPFQHCNT